MPTIPNPDPVINSPIGVHGSIIRILQFKLTDSVFLQGAPPVTGVEFVIRPAQLKMYPAVVIESDGTVIDYAFENNKTKYYRVKIMVFGLTLSDAELLGEAVERALETDGPENAQSAVLQIASMNKADPDGITIEDEGNERYDIEREWPMDGGIAKRTHMGTLNYKIGIVRSF